MRRARRVPSVEDMVTVGIPLRSVRRSLVGASRAGAAALSIAGMCAAIVVAVLGLLVVPLAAAIAFGPALLAAF